MRTLSPYEGDLRVTSHNSQRVLQQSSLHDIWRGTQPCVHIFDLWALFINQSTAPINALKIHSLYLLCLFMIYTRAVFRATGSEYSHVCPRVSSAVKPFYWLNFMKVCRPSSMQTTSQCKTNSSSCQMCPVPTDSATWNLRELNKNIFCDSNVIQPKRVERGFFCTTEKLWETLGVLVCCPAHVLEVAFPQRVWQWLSG